jgi:hypothetical protein
MPEAESEYDIDTRLENLADKMVDPDDANLLRVAAEEIRRLTPERKPGRRSEQPQPGNPSRIVQLLPPESNY